jgi:hypothetical protein
MPERSIVHLLSVPQVLVLTFTNFDSKKPKKTSVNGTQKWSTLVHLLLVLRKQILTKLFAPLGLFLGQLDKGKCFSDSIVRKVSA